LKKSQAWFFEQIKLLKIFLYRPRIYFDFSIFNEKLGKEFQGKSFENFFFSFSSSNTVIVLNIRTP